jgi:hypothetical protein
MVLWPGIYLMALSLMALWPHGLMVLQEQRSTTPGPVALSPHGLMAGLQPYGLMVSGLVALCGLILLDGLVRALRP